MIPHYKAVHNRFKFNGYHYSYSGLKEVAYSFVKEGEPFEKEIGNFLLDWLDSKPTIEVKTSGSTGKPKTVELQKQAMIYSAIATGDYFKLEPGDAALLCLPATYIAGKMMLIRAIILGLNLDIVAPNSNPLAFVNKKYKFSAMVPMQVQKSITKLSLIDTLIVGGTKVPQKLIDELQNCSTKVFETYGMTETITHIAARSLNGASKGDDNCFETLPNIEISQDGRDCLVISASYISNEPIVTNDIVVLKSETKFQLLGRFDNVINSGGIKVHPEQVEQKLSSVIMDDFFIASRKSDVLGEEVVLFVEGTTKVSPDDFNNLEKEQIPKAVFYIETFNRTSSGKINRAKTVELSKALS